MEAFLLLQEQREHDNMGLGRPMKCSPAYWERVKQKEAASGGQALEAPLFRGGGGGGKEAAMGFAQGRAFLVSNEAGAAAGARRLDKGEYASGESAAWDAEGEEEAVLQVEGNIGLQADMESGKMGEEPPLTAMMKKQQRRAKNRRQHFIEMGLPQAHPTPPLKPTPTPLTANC